MSFLPIQCLSTKGSHAWPPCNDLGKLWDDQHQAEPGMSSLDHWEHCPQKILKLVKTPERRYKATPGCSGHNLPCSNSPAFWDVVTRRLSVLLQYLESVEKKKKEAEEDIDDIKRGRKEAFGVVLWEAFGVVLWEAFGVVLWEAFGVVLWEAFGVVLWDAFGVVLYDQDALYVETVEE
ncbi:hypothetical protein STEG23_006986 [Scotinomys teguina]